MDYVSTRNNKKNFSFEDVFLKGLAPDGGLFVPKKIPLYSSEEMSELRNFSYKELANKIIFDYCGLRFNKNEIENLINDSYKNFSTDDVVKIIKIKNINLLELFHGPTLAFKDIALQVIGNMYEKILKKNDMNINIVVATSGDTGAAAINALSDRKNIKIFVLHPFKKISEVQRRFMTTVDSKNVFNIAVDGNFDDCQKLVKSMFADKNFSNSIKMSGVNSINWSRIVFQIVYYFFSYFRITKKDEKINYVVPTGNFGDIYAGYIAKKMGLPINKLVIATNKNDILKRAVNTGLYKPQKVQHTISPSMDIQVASNFERLVFDVYSCDSDKILKLMKNFSEKNEIQIDKKELAQIRESFLSESLNDEETRLIIKRIYKNEKKLIDPHTAIGIGVAEKIKLKENTVILSTAHPAKFSEVVFNETGVKPELPENLKNILTKKEKYEKLSRDLTDIQKYILSIV
mgnify:CR=1 FL=1